MGRPPSNGSPAFRFSSNEVAEMENILREHKAQVPSRDVLEALAGKFSSSEERSGKIKVQAKQVWNWFQNRRFALRAKQTKPPEMFSTPPPLPRFNAGQNVHQAPNAVRTVPQAPQLVTSQGAVQGGGRPVSDNSPLEFEAKSARDGAWYDVASFLSHRSLETDEPDVLVRFAGFGSEEDEWVNVRKHVRPRSLPCEASECVAILPRDLILCFQEGKEQALYYDAHVIDSQRRRHDVRGCRCRFLVRYDHDQSEEIVPLRKVCRRPETDYRLLQLQSMNESGAIKQQKTNVETPHMGNTLRVYPPSEPMPKSQKPEESISHGNRSKILQTKNPEMGAGVALKTPAVPPGFEAVTSGIVKNSNSSGETSIAMEVKPPETSNHEVVTPVVTEIKSLETKNSEVTTPLATEVENLQTKNLEVSAGGVAETSTLIAVEVKSPETKNPEVGAGENSAVFPSNDVLTSGAVTNSAVGGDILVAPVVESLDSVASASGGVKIPTVPPGFEAVTGGNTRVTMEIEITQTRNTEVTAGDVGRTSTNEALTSGASPNSKTSVDASAVMEVESLETKDHEITAGDVGGTSTNEALTSGACPNSKTSADISVAMEVESLQTKDLEVCAGDAVETSTIPSNKVLTSVDTLNCNANDLAENMLEW